MTALMFVLALSLQEDSIESLLRSLASEKVQERERAAAEIKRRGESAIDRLRKAEEKAGTPAEKARIRQAYEDILGYKPLSADLVRSLRVSVRLPRSKASEVVAELQKASGLPVNLDAPPNLDPELSATEARDESLETVLDRVSRMAGGHWLITGRHLLLVLPGAIPVKLFDIRDFREAQLDERPVSLEPGGSPFGAFPEGTLSPLSITDLMTLIRHDVSPKSWEESEERSLQSDNGWLIARNDPDVLTAVGEALEKYRRQFLVELRVEIEAYAVRASAKVEEEGLGWLREQAVEGKTARRVASFDRVGRDKRGLALSSVTRLTFLTSYDADKNPGLEVFSAGTRANVRASLSDNRRTARAELDIGWTRLLSVETRKEAAGDTQVPVFASHAVHATTLVPTERFTFLGRVGETNIVEGLPDLVVIGRFTPVLRK